jgi:hypothetical protein
MGEANTEQKMSVAGRRTVNSGFGQGRISQLRTEFRDN